ncbi:MAG: hypothetical protein ACUVTO_01100 [Candidatus Caldatribacteriaceae bacterium]
MVEIRLSNGVIKCNITPNTACQAYAPAPEVFEDEYITEKLEIKAGWNFPSPDEYWMRGYPHEMQDFVEAVYYGRDPLSDVKLGRDLVQVVYASYVSAELGRRIDLEEFEKEREMNKRSKMKAAIKPDERPELVLQEVDIPEPRPDEALVRVRAAGLCGTDVAIRNNTFMGRHGPVRPSITPAMSFVEKWWQSAQR